MVFLLEEIPDEFFAHSKKDCGIIRQLIEMNNPDLPLIKYTFSTTGLGLLVAEVVMEKPRFGIQDLSITDWTGKVYGCAYLMEIILRFLGQVVRSGFIQLGFSKNIDTCVSPSPPARKQRRRYS